ncbi:MAG: bifunctional 5,10-methylene-tetrahydrofolate dehydrogenase/5,10-methylene-tetrahydrofolate cyclohydrolase [Candidatus Omnitrophica bacterium CG_4_9_14_0_2_um_filter_42_8]|nr:MAG: bifunctional 5,10-methylene-tetrahydrofolate dehydrogenase/5,10-methylene-tetrahydrofolate cyclohydrolase [Candidatus Omnitrophica bacterium CG22_combo_CG10-13_8_21_14_all_43_16]PJC48288.1 MAG: bifunctional 5,10-methylene-tetrahydrofolate dehydrogenase/5,10-methylene-tetrahydrofolate cyclohydrolase [Candidatus Omnitrophica bacterium CG_4_9_14_0_2_um_filter_42_8]
MPGKLLEGKSVALKIKENIKLEVGSLKTKYGLSPKLVSMQVGENPASEIYIKSQEKTARDLGIDYELKKLPSDINQDEFIKAIESLNKDKSVNGIIIQMPLPQHIDAKLISRYLSPLKDIEAVHPQNMGEIVFGTAKILPCTAAACMELLNSIDLLELYGKEAVVVGHSEIVGKPLALLLLNKFVTTTVCHIATGKRGTLPEFVKKAEILIVAVGKAGIVKGEWVKEGAIVIDVGINRVEGKIVGDVEFERAVEKASYITPVPGGVGPLTVTILMRNVVEAFKQQQGV